MKKNLMVLVLLVTWSLVSIPNQSLAANDSMLPDNSESNCGSSSPGPIVHVTGATDDDKGGDPGDATDGFGISEVDIDGGRFGECDGVDASVIDEYLLFIVSLIQLAL